MAVKVIHVMKKVLFYGMAGEKMCFSHVLLNALDLSAGGAEVKIIFEGASVKLVSVLEEEKDPLYLKAKEQGLIAGVCKVWRFDPRKRQTAESGSRRRYA